MEVQRYAMARRVVVRQGDNGSATAGQRIENCILSLFRHLLTQYRMRARRRRPYSEAVTTHTPTDHERKVDMSYRQTMKSIAFTIVVLLMSSAPRAFGAPEKGRCASQPESRALDFWVGEWKITVSNENVNAVSKVSLQLDDCVVVEQWNGGDGHSGENMFGYSADDKSWHGMFADSVGHIHVFLNG